jgi:hypothetical protein
MPYPHGRPANPGQASNAVLLGVTRALARLRWPHGSSLMAVDSAEAMARAVWPGDLPNRSWAVCGDWLFIPRSGRSCDVVLGDGSISCLAFPDGCRALAAMVSGILQDDGILVLRCYLQPPVPERPGDVFADLTRGTAPSFNQFKFRLLMAMQQSAERGVAANAVYRAGVDREFDEDWLVPQTGWQPARFA